MKIELHDKMEEKMDKTVSAYKDELNSIRAGRANPSLLDRISVDYYGVQTPLNQLANVSAPEPRMIVIQPYDANILADIEKAIQVSDLGLNPSNDGKIIRLAVPQLTEERRKDLIKVVKKASENAKVGIRNHRREANDEIKKMLKNNDITEDDSKAYEDSVQEITDVKISQIDKMTEEKEKELLEV